MQLLEGNKMSERKTVYKWFWVWNFEKGERWLNEMAMDGWTLCNVGIGKYEFERTQPGEYIIRLELHKYDEHYIEFMHDTGAEVAGRLFSWVYFKRKSELGQFDIFSDIDSKIQHLNKISRMISIIGGANLIIGFCNSVSPYVKCGWINLLCATLLMYALGRIHGKKEALENNRLLHE